jgi:superfamily II DNA/RNA helicase
VREINLNKFRKGEQKILIATDVAARGLDIPEVELIIQLSPPENPEPYIHRSGRTGRAGKEGVNITFFNESNIEDLMEIERAAKIKIKIINNNFNITLWKKEADHLIEEIANN